MNLSRTDGPHPFGDTAPRHRNHIGRERPESTRPGREPTASVKRVQAVPAVETTRLHKNYGDVQSLRGVNLRVETGSIFGLLGPNGAGKTTAVRILTTLLLPDEGSARVTGFAVVRDAANVREQIGRAGARTAVLLRSLRRRRPPRPHVLRRDAPPPRPRGGASRPTAGPIPR